MIPSTEDPLLRRALNEKLGLRVPRAGGMGELEPLAARIGLILGSLKPRLHGAHLMIFAGDHGIAVDGLQGYEGLDTDTQVRRLLGGRLPVSVLAQQHGMGLTVVDAGVSETLREHERLLVRKIAHGTRHARLAQAMTPLQVRAAIAQGNDIGAALPGNVLACAGLGVGAWESAALVLARLSGVDVREFLFTGLGMSPERLERLLVITLGVETRHRGVADALDVLAAFGGLEVAMMCGAMIAVAQRRGLLMVDGLPALAALKVASQMAPAITDYCVFCRSHPHQGLDRALALFKGTAILEMGLDAVDGTGAVVSWPLIRSAAALLSEVAEGEDPGPTHPQPLDLEPLS